ncbi:heavy metal transporter [Hathewaya limosa]|uniref:Copper chaperone CopZ n=1 Tax=Hathewaya limosa TaxID=1536 RepID=A0ABU0JTL4_HATLI|nr:heavy metal transporter [Hathewaya limosa]AWZ47920.1 heavy metal transporter [Clostridiaceae bacterium 14S0207]MDQ0480439.1 copper chaperone CopZ [Hathewaya limosa]
MRKVQYNVSGIVNSTTKTQLRNALDKIEGVQEVSVDQGRASVCVGYNEPANEEEIKMAIDKIEGCDIE